MAQNPPTWSDADKVALRNFVASNPNFTAELMRRLPKIEGNTVEARAMTGSDVKGYIDCIETITSMQQDTPQPDSTEFIDDRTQR